MGKSKNTSGKAKSETMTMRVTPHLKERITTLQAVTNHRNNTLLSFIGVLIEMGIELCIKEEVANGHLSADSAKRLA